MTDIAEFREFISPHDYVYQDCVIYRGVMYQCNNLEGTGGRWIEHDWDIFISSAITEEVEEISELLSATIVVMTDRINTNTREIQNLNRLVANLVFVLLEQGIKINDKLLLNELKRYGHTS